MVVFFNLKLMALVIFLDSLPNTKIILNSENHLKSKELIKTKRGPLIIFNKFSFKNKLKLYNFNFIIVKKILIKKKLANNCTSNSYVQYFFC